MAKLVLLGTKGGPSLRGDGASFLPTSSHLAIAGRSIIIDCGLGVTASMVKAGYPLTGLTNIFITHCHSDHVLEFGALLICPEIWFVFGVLEFGAKWDLGIMAFCAYFFWAHLFATI